MKIGTKSVLFGVHCFLIHPLVVAWAWFKLYGFSRQYIGTDMRLVGLGSVGGQERYLPREVRASILHPRMWLAFFLHDIGYWGSPNMDGPEGERHPEVGARILKFITGSMAWHDFVYYHSRFLAKREGRLPSTLCIADKLAICLPPRWLYLLMGGWTGEIEEYMAKSDRNNATGSKYAHMHPSLGDRKQWHADMVAYVRRWVEEHKDGREDTWTPQPWTPTAALGKPKSDHPFIININTPPPRP